MVFGFAQKVLRSFVLLNLTVGTLSISSGCVNLDARDPSPFRFGQKTANGQTVATQAGVRQSASKIKNIAKPSALAKTMKQAWPFRKKVRATIQDDPVFKDDPTRLDYVPENVGADLHIAAAKLAERNGEPKVALEQYEKALAKDGRNRNALIGFARLQHRTGNTDQAIRVYRDALNLYRNDAVIMNDLGICYAQQSKLNESIAMLTSATEAAPERDMYMNNLAAALVEANRTNEAFSRLAQQRGPAMANYNIGFLLTKSGRRQEAQQYLQQALALQPNLQQARSLLDESIRVSSLPNNRSQPQPQFEPANAQQYVPTYSPVSSSGYQIPPVEKQSLNVPQNERPPAVRANVNVPPVDSIPSWQDESRSGPFGYSPKRSDAIRVVNYVEDIR